MLDILIYIETGIRNQWYLFKGLLLKFYLLSHGCNIGKRLKCKKWPTFRSVPKGNIIIGNSVTIGHNITLDVDSRGRLIIEDYINLTQDILISSYKKVYIGASSLIGENVSIRDADHGLAPNKIIRGQSLQAKEIYIGEDVWIGAGCRVLRGAYISDGAVIVANSIVHARSAIEKYKVYAGCPVRFLKNRIG